MTGSVLCNPSRTCAHANPEPSSANRTGYYVEFTNTRALEIGDLALFTPHIHYLRIINQGVFQIFMPEQDLNGAEIRAGFIEMCRKTVAKRVGMNAFLETGALSSSVARVPNGFRIDRAIFAIVAGEQPGAGFPVVETPKGAECRE